MVAGWVENNDTIMIEQMPIFGGYAGGLEETTVINMASHLISFTMYHCDWHLDGPIHVRWGITTARECLAVAGHVSAALNEQKPDILIGNQYYPLSGPCTEMCLKEVAAQAMTDTVSGREIMSGSASAKGVLQDYTTSMESKMMGEAAEAIAGLDVSEANEIIDEVVSSYEDDYMEADNTKDPENTELGNGKKMQQCYNMDDLTPTDEYWEVYQSAKEEMKELGLEF